MQPAKRLRVSAERRSISAATTLAPKFEATTLKSSVAKTESAIRVGLPNHSSNDHVAGRASTDTEANLPPIFGTIQPPYCATDPSAQFWTRSDPNRIEIGQRIRLPLSPAPQNSTRSLQGERQGKPIVALAK